MNDDCGCVGLHDGKTHDQYMDEFWRTKNLEMLARGDDTSLPVLTRWLALAGFAKEEEARLTWKLTWLKE